MANLHPSKSLVITCRVSSPTPETPPPDTYLKLSNIQRLIQYDKEKAIGQIDNQLKQEKGMGELMRDLHNRDKAKLRRRLDEEKIKQNYSGVQMEQTLKHRRTIGDNEEDLMDRVRNFKQNEYEKLLEVEDERKKLVGKLKGSDYNVDQLAKRDRGLRENRKEQVDRILYDQDAIERERQLMMNKVSNYDPKHDPSLHPRKEVAPNLLSGYKSMPEIAPLNLKEQGREFLKLEQANKADHFKLVDKPRSKREVPPLIQMPQKQSMAPIHSHRAHRMPSTSPALPPPLPPQGFGFPGSHPHPLVGHPFGMPGMPGMPGMAAPFGPYPHPPNTIPPQFRTMIDQAKLENDRLTQELDNLKSGSGGLDNGGFGNIAQRAEEDIEKLKKTLLPNGLGGGGTNGDPFPEDFVFRQNDFRSEDLEVEERALLNLNLQEYDNLRVLSKLPANSELYRYKMDQFKEASTIRGEIEKVLHEQRLEKIRRDFEKAKYEDERKYNHERWLEEQKREILAAKLRTNNDATARLNRNQSLPDLRKAKGQILTAYDAPQSSRYQPQSSYSRQSTARNRNDYPNIPPVLSQRQRY
ncbi:unnamed protein product [Moneuplotes crassus]|uniref:Uncharacterized protein n=2 Tax=Euplotes crassus TaxID=5936 RepID=A0AAD1YAW5_EUPCR|nr:unnamed protein product [Moneuplotes crassus]